MSVPSTPTLHMFYLGGNAGRSNIEVHDVQFVACRSVEEAFPRSRLPGSATPTKCISTATSA